MFRSRLVVSSSVTGMTMKMLRKLAVASCAGAAAFACLPEAAVAGDVKLGRALTQKCEACHGTDGVAKIAEAPNIAGQNEAYIVKQLTAFKSGERKNDMMTVVAPTLSDDDIANLAAYYSAIPVTVGKLPGE